MQQLQSCSEPDQLTSREPAIALTLSECQLDTKLSKTEPIQKYYLKTSTWSALEPRLGQDQAETTRGLLLTEYLGYERILEWR